jgi:hypothetical protein
VQEGSTIPKRNDQNRNPAQHIIVKTIITDNNYQGKNIDGYKREKLNTIKKVNQSKQQQIFFLQKP